MATYRSGAEIKYGSFAAETPSEAELARRAGAGALSDTLVTCRKDCRRPMSFDT